MNTYAEQTQADTSQTVTTETSQQSEGSPIPFFANHRPEAIAQRKMQEMVDNSPKVKQLKTLQQMADNYSASKVIQLAATDEKSTTKKKKRKEESSNPHFIETGEKKGDPELVRHHILPYPKLTQLHDNVIGMYNSLRQTRLNEAGNIDLGEPPGRNEAAWAPGVIWIGPKERNDDPGNKIERKMMGKLRGKVTPQHRYYLENMAEDIDTNFMQAGASRIQWFQGLIKKPAIAYKREDWEQDSSTNEWSLKD